MHPDLNVFIYLCSIPPLLRPATLSSRLLVARSDDGPSRGYPETDTWIHRYTFLFPCIQICMYVSICAVYPCLRPAALSSRLLVARGDDGPSRVNPKVHGSIDIHTFFMHPDLSIYLYLSHLPPPRAQLLFLPAYWWHELTTGPLGLTPPRSISVSIYI